MWALANMLNPTANIERFVLGVEVPCWMTKENVVCGQFTVVVWIAEAFLVDNREPQARSLGRNFEKTTPRPHSCNSRRMNHDKHPPRPVRYRDRLQRATTRAYSQPWRGQTTGVALYRSPLSLSLSLSLSL